MARPAVRRQLGWTAMKFGVGQAVSRIEDRRLLRGGGRYSDDIDAPGQARGHILRSPHAHALIRGIDAAAARAAPGVLGVFTAADLAADGIGGLPCLASRLVALKRPDGRPMHEPRYPVLAEDKVAFVGQPAAFVVAETQAQAQDAAELIEVDYAALPAVTQPLQAVAPGASALWADCPDNVSFEFEAGDRAAVEAAFAAARHVTRIEVPISRVAVTPMEPRAAIGAYDRFEERYTLTTGTQFPHDLRGWLAENVLGVPESRLRVISPDMGGSFGLRSTVFPELPLVLWAARRLGRPVKWTNTRSDAFLDEPARDLAMRVALALDAEGRFLALEVESVNNLGAYLSIFGPLPSFSNLGGLAGPYAFRAIHVRARGVFTNTGPIVPYRGAGRPEATLALERTIDRAARELGIDSAELRRRNLVPPEAMPYKTALTFTYDSGDFATVLERTLARADWAGFEARRAAAEAEGRLRGIGIAYAIEQAAGMWDEGAELRFDRNGEATLLMGTHSHGQGHETVMRQVLVQRLGLDFERIRYVQGDTDLVPYGHGTGGSRVSGLGTAAVLRAADRIVEKGRLIAAERLEAAVEDIEFRDGRFAVAGTDRGLGLAEIARIALTPGALPAGMDSGLAAFASFKPSGPTFPNACHVAEVEIDPETGNLAVLRYVAVDDVGVVLNPLLLEGQLHGGIAQGLGQILSERLVFDDQGQLLTGSFMDYAMPRADQMPGFEIETHVVPTAINPLGVKGAGEAGTVGAMACLMSAIDDALAPLGAAEFAMPATPERLWRAIRAARPA
jgi:carbon-monoxide dehydrogenase large subunit